MIIFAVTQTMIMALVEPLFDVVLASPGQTVEPTHVSREQATRDKVVNFVLERDRPEGQRNWFARGLGSGIQRATAWWRPKPLNDQARTVLLTMLLVFVLRTFTSFFSEYAFQKVGLSTVRDLRDELYERLIYQSHRFFSERSTGEMVSRIVSDADAIQAAVSTRMGDLFQESITLIGLSLYILVTNTELALVSFVAAPALIYPVVPFGRRLL